MISSRPSLAFIHHGRVVRREQRRRLEGHRLRKQRLRVEKRRGGALLRRLKLCRGFRCGIGPAGVVDSRKPERLGGRGAGRLAGRRALEQQVGQLGVIHLREL
eukprot:scaffold114583_cov27-Prasinocladus_malaysianus.AAC.1